MAERRQHDCAIIVWDRSEIILLKHLCADIRQVRSILWHLAWPNGCWLAQRYSGRRPARRFLLNTVATNPGFLPLPLPHFATSADVDSLHVISAALAAPALLFLFGNQYKGAVMVATLAPLLCMPKAFIGPVQSLLQSAERQGYVILATVLAGVVDMGVAWYLIPAHGRWARASAVERHR